MGDFEYLHVVGPTKDRKKGKMKLSRRSAHTAEPPVEHRIPQSGQSDFLAGMKRTTPSVKFAFYRTLKKCEKEGMPYSMINSYLRGELGSAHNNNPMGMGYILEMLTWDPRHDPAKTYAEAYQFLERQSSSLDWSHLYDVVEGMKFE